MSRAMMFSMMVVTCAVAATHASATDHRQCDDPIPPPAAVSQIEATTPLPDFVVELWAWLASQPFVEPMKASPWGRAIAASAGFPEVRSSDEIEALRMPLETRSPGADTSLCMSWEPAIAVSRLDPRQLAVAQSSTVRVSTDGGDNFAAGVTAGNLLPTTHTICGDPSLAYDSQGRLFLAFLGCFGGNRIYDVFITEHDPTDGSVVAGPFNVTQQVGLAAPTFSNDKPWLAADANLGSPYSDRLYLVWTELTGTTTGDWEVWGAYSVNQGQTWTASQQTAALPGPLSAQDTSEGKVWPAHITVGPGSNVYIAYHSQTGFLDSGRRVPDGVSGSVQVLRSADGGVLFPQKSTAFAPGDADATWNVQHLAGALDDAQFWAQGNSQATTVVDINDPSVVMVIASDDPDDDPTSGDPADVMFVQSDDFGVTWSAPTQVDSGPSGTFQLMPMAAIDPITGALAVTYYDNRNAASYPLGSQGNSRIELIARYSLNGGQSWLPEVVISDTAFDADASTSCRFCCNSSSSCWGSPMTNRIGEYNGVAFGECTAYAVWAGDATCGGSTDILFDRDPEAGGDLDPPFLQCPDNDSIGCSDLPDPRITGSATARDTCDADPEVDYFDVTTPGNCPPSTVVENIERTWFSTDAAGNLETCVQNISVVDFDAPVLTVPDPIVLACNSPGGVAATDPQIQAWLDSASAVDECSDAEVSNSASGLFPSGCEVAEPTLVVFSASDACGNSSGEASTVSVLDISNPTVEAPDPIVIECRETGGVPSDHPEVLAWLATATAVDNCWSVAITDSAPALLPSGCAPGQVTNVIFTGTDECGNSNFDVAPITVVDTIAPSIDVAAETVVLTEPDHQYVCFEDFSTRGRPRDRCDQFPTFDVVCESNQCDDAPCPEYPGQDGDGATINDCVYDPGLDLLCARAERADTVPEGRTYSVYFESQDACSNQARALAMAIWVPRTCEPGGDCIFIDGFGQDTSAWSTTVGD